jgi:AhpD family alkylhydroperoxidase
MAESPALVNSYVYTAEQVDKIQLSATEQQIVMMTINRFHECRYCIAGHSKLAEQHDIDMKVINAIRDDKPLDNPKYAALRSFTLKLTKTRGVVSQTLVNAFFNAGYNRQHALDVIAMVALKVMSNYTNHLVGTEIDGMAMSKRWSPIKER